MCVIIDLFSRMVVGWKLSNSMKASLVCDTLNASFVKRGRPTNLIFHSDQVFQYTSSEFKNLLDYFNITASFSKKGYPYDNAPMERYFNTLKNDLINHHYYHREKELYTDVEEFAYFHYKHVRPHSYNDYKTPFEARYNSEKKMKKIRQ